MRRRLRSATGRNRRVTSVRERARNAAQSTLASLRHLLPSTMLFVLMVLAPALAHATWEYLTRSPVFAVKEVVIEGAQWLTRARVEGFVQAASGGNLLRLDKKNLIHRLDQTGWVKGVEIERHLPGKVVLRLTENRPVGTLLGAGPQMVDRSGVPFRNLLPGEQLPRPLLSGIVDPDTRAGSRVLRRALALAAFYRRSGMPRFDTLAEVHHDKARGFSLVTERHKMVVHLGHDRFAKGIKRLRFVVQDSIRRGLGVPAEVHAYVGKDKVVVTPSRKGRKQGPAVPERVRVAREH
jgi:cell division septal protein FtsQ